MSKPNEATAVECPGHLGDANAEHERTCERGLPPRRVPTVEEAEAILTLVRGGWLRLDLTLDGA